MFEGAGHEASSILGQSIGGASDPDVAAVCQQEQRALLTLDVDFADLRAHPPEDNHGLVVLRSKRQDKPHVMGVIGRLLPMPKAEQLVGRPWIVEEERVRIRG